MAGNALLHAHALLRSAGIRPGMHVADFGVGRTGHLVIPAAKMVGDEGVVYGIDVVPEALRMLEGRRRMELLHNLKLVWGDVEHIGGVRIPDRSLDLAFVVNTLWMARQHATIAVELRRLLKPRGRLVVIDWHDHRSHPVAPPAHLRVSGHAIDLAFVRNGLRKHGEFAPSPWHWGRAYVA